MSTVPPYLRRAQSPDKGVAGRKAEKGLAQRLGGTVRPGSGALAGAKGDVTLHDFLIESKTTLSASLVLKQEWLHKIYQEALETNKTAALAIAFVGESGQSQKRDRWVMVPEAVWAELVEKA